MRAMPGKRGRHISWRVASAGRAQHDSLYYTGSMSEPGSGVISKALICTATIM